MAIAPSQKYSDRYVNLSNGLISREIFVNDAIYQQELEQIFARSWLFMGHESQIVKPGDYFISGMGEESVIMCWNRADEACVLEFLSLPRNGSVRLRRGQYSGIHLFLPRLELCH